jgi:dGTP triphosphohydrolase
MVDIRTSCYAARLAAFSCPQKHWKALIFRGAHKPDGHEWSEYQCLRRVIDYVSGMTDNYAVYVASQLQGSGFSGLQRP